MLRILFYTIGILLRLMPLVVFYIALYRSPWHNRLKKAGYTEKETVVGEVRFHYAESGNSDQTPLLLLHAGMLDWFSYHRVMVKLCADYHVYAVDYPGQGKTRYPDDYEMNAVNIGTSLAQFIEEVIGEPVSVCGNGEGGLLAVRLAAERPDLIMAAVLEDPPLFTSEYPAIRNTAAYRSFRICDRAVSEDREGDYLRFRLRNSSDLAGIDMGYVKKGILTILIIVSRMLHWQKTTEIPFVSEYMREIIRGLDQYSPYFGKAFYDGKWNENFDHTEALCRIQCPVLLMQADTLFLSDGTLKGAMSEENAQFACSRLKNVKYKKMHSKHVIHLDQPEEYLMHVTDFLSQSNKDNI